MPRATAPVLGTVLLVGVTVLIVVVLAVAVTGFALPEHATPVVIEASADADGRVTLEHVSGPSLDVRELTLTVEVDDEPLEHQPPVPFTGAPGFKDFPSGPFNPSADPTWDAGETASFRLAGTNDPDISLGSTVTVMISRDGRLLARATATVT